MRANTLWYLFMAVALGAPVAVADEGKNESGQRERREGRDKDNDRERKHEKDREWKHDKDYRERRSDKDRYDDDRRTRQSYFHEHGYTRLNIPKGHYPPPGECRIWYPDRPPGHQPPPGNCNQLSRRVPGGAWLITHPSDHRDHVHINVYDVRQPGIVVTVGLFDINTGSFIRALR